MYLQEEFWRRYSQLELQKQRNLTLNHWHVKSVVKHCITHFVFQRDCRRSSGACTLSSSMKLGNRRVKLVTSALM